MQGKNRSRNNQWVVWNNKGLPARIFLWTTLMQCIPKWFALPGEKLNIIHVRRRPSIKLSHAAETIKEVEQILNEERNKVSQWYDKNFLKGCFSKCHLDHNLWPRIKEQGIESQNAEYWGGTKTWAKAARCFCGWTTKIYNSREQHLQERCKSCRHDIEMTEINAYQQIANCQICSIATSHCHLMPDARKLEKLQERALCAVCCNKRMIITFGWFACFKESSATRRGHGYV